MEYLNNYFIKCVSVLSETKKFEYKIEKIKTTHYPVYPSDMTSSNNRLSYGIEDHLKSYLDLRNLELDCLNKNGKDGRDFHSRYVLLSNVGEGKEDIQYIIFTFKREIS